MRQPRLGVAVLVCNSERQALVIQRAYDPQAGCWALPGGKVEWGESLSAAAAREIHEECGLDVAIGDWLHVAEILDVPASVHFVVVDFGAVMRRPGSPVRLGSDAALYRWVGPADLPELPWASGMQEFWASAAVRRFLGWPPIGP